LNDVTLEDRFAVRHLAYLSQRPARPRPATQFGPRWTCDTCGTHTRLRVCPQCTDTDPGNPDTYVSTTSEPGNPYARLRRWAHMLGFGGHFLTKARRYSVTFALLRAARVDYRRATDDTDAAVIRAADHTDEETTLIIGTLTFAGASWHNTGDALLANTSAAKNAPMTAASAWPPAGTTFDGVDVLDSEMAYAVGAPPRPQPPCCSRTATPRRRSCGGTLSPISCPPPLRCRTPHQTLPMVAWDFRDVHIPSACPATMP
jgi:hypothetical protein